MNKTLLSLMLCLTLAAALCACRAESYQRVPAPPQDVEVPAQNMTRIYIVRMPQALGRYRAVRASENDREIGRIGRDCYLCWERPAGRSLVILTYESGELEEADRQTMIDVKGEPGQTYYFGLSIDDSGRKALCQPLPRDDARRMIQDQQQAPPE
jgi:hypothetical protein